MPKDGYFAESVEEARKIVREKNIPYPIIVTPDENSPYRVVNNDGELEQAVGEVLEGAPHAQVLPGPRGLASGEYPAERGTVK